MHEASPSHPRWLCWLPAAALVAVEIYIRNFDGWGAWAAAPLVLLPGLIGLPIALVGLFDCWAALRAGAPIRGALLFTVLSALPIAWLGVRRFLV